MKVAIGRYVKFGLQLGQIGTKWDKSGNLHFSKFSLTELILKDFVLIGAIICHPDAVTVPMVTR